jgi:F0F1-type ATP synthase membrane subunit b/b'
VNSPEFVAIFDQVTGGLESLADFTGERGRSVEEISAEIERLTAENEATLKSIDAKIEAAQERLASIGQSTADNTFHASRS